MKYYETFNFKFPKKQKRKKYEIEWVKIEGKYFNIGKIILYSRLYFSFYRTYIYIYIQDDKLGIVNTNVTNFYNMITFSDQKIMKFKHDNKDILIAFTDKGWIKIMKYFKGIVPEKSPIYLNINITQIIIIIIIIILSLALGYSLREKIYKNGF
tara:strand:+ start:318 stop:779 length:462 start_codon:yes stop_codon:yes gene_type:complete